MATVADQHWSVEETRAIRVILLCMVIGGVSVLVSRKTPDEALSIVRAYGVVVEIFAPLFLAALAAAIAHRMRKWHPFVCTVFGLAIPGFVMSLLIAFLPSPSLTAMKTSGLRTTARTDSRTVADENTPAAKRYQRGLQLLDRDPAAAKRELRAAVDARPDWFEAARDYTNACMLVLEKEKSSGVRASDLRDYEAALVRMQGLLAKPKNHDQDMEVLTDRTLRAVRSALKKAEGSQ